MSASGRLAGDGWGVLVDPARPVDFLFDGRRHRGLEGDVIASALLASGRSVLSRSFKYHRPRGPLTMAGHDVNSLVQVGAEPNVRGDRRAITPGLDVTSVNRLGSLDHDLLSAIGWFSRLLPAGFYYRSFFRPRGAWAYFERPIRHLAGLGRLDPHAPHGTYDKAYLFCDVAVVGGGPAGLAAAIASAEQGADTLLFDEWPQPGGSLLYGRLEGDRDAAATVREGLLKRAAALPKLRLMADTAVTGLFADNWLSATTGNRLLKIRAGRTVLATGAFDQPLVFPDNDRPGIMFGDAVQRLLRLYAVRPGRRAVVATANRFGTDVALDLADAGVEVAAVVDLRDRPPPAEAERLKARGIPLMPAASLVGSRGKASVSAVAVAPRDAGGAPQWIDCDLVAMCVGYAPALNLAAYVGARIDYDGETAMHRADALPPWLSLAGAAAGHWSDARVRDEATAIGRAAAEAVRSGTTDPGAAPARDPGAAAVSDPWPMSAHAGRAKAFVDFDEDLVSADIIDTVRTGYNDIQLVKRYSTAGLGPSQGRHANVNTIRLVAAETGRPAHEIGTTTFRPPLLPETFGHLAGRGFEPRRLTAMHGRHVELGARMMPAGAWMRPAYYGPRDASAEAIAAEVAAVRTGVGLIDVSTLGGLDIRGPDAAEFIGRMYTGAFAKQPVGRARYALMTDQTGVVIDDGVACRLHDRHFYVTATTTGVDTVYRQMTWWNAQWRLDVDVANVTAAFAAVNLAGPRSREVLARLPSDIDTTPAAFPYMAVREGLLAGIPVRMLRVGFVGELGFEIHCPAGCGEALWDALMTAGGEAGVRPFGVEAQRVLRLEKGHIIIGQDTDGLTNPLEAGMAWALAKTKPFYVGKRAVDIQGAKGLSRQLVGFAVRDATAPCPLECHLVIENGDIAGRVTSAVRSATLGHVIGLAYVPPAKAAVGSRFAIRIEQGRMIEAEVVELPFYDGKAARQEM